MAKKAKKKVSPKAIEGVEETLTKTEQFLENNWKTITYGLGAVAVIVGIVWLYNKRVDSKTEEALSQMYVAEDYFANDSLDLALYGDGNYLGFIDIADEYKSTRPGNLANYYAGICYLRSGQYEDAIDYLERFKYQMEKLRKKTKEEERKRREEAKKLEEQARKLLEQSKEAKKGAKKLRRI